MYNAPKMHFLIPDTTKEYKVKELEIFTVEFILGAKKLPFSVRTNMGRKIIEQNADDLHSSTDDNPNVKYLQGKNE